MLAAMDSQPGAQRMPTYSVGSARFLARVTFGRADASAPSGRKDSCNLHEL